MSVFLELMVFGILRSHIDPAWGTYEDSVIVYDTILYKLYAF